MSEDGFSTLECEVLLSVLPTTVGGKYPPAKVYAGAIDYGHGDECYELSALITSAPLNENAMYSEFKDIVGYRGHAGFWVANACDGDVEMEARKIIRAIASRRGVEWDGSPRTVYEVLDGATATAKIAVDGGGSPYTSLPDNEDEKSDFIDFELLPK